MRVGGGTATDGINENERAGRLTIAAFDDDRMMLSIISETLEMEGYEVHTHQRWDDAHHVVRQVHPDLVMLDLRMGGSETGWKVLDQLALDPETRGIPVILCSGATASLDARRPALLPECGVYVLSKPFDLDVLVGTVEGALAARSPVSVPAS